MRNRLVIVAPADNPGAIASINDLATPGLKLVLAAPEVFNEPEREQVIGDLLAWLASVVSSS